MSALRQFHPRPAGKWLCGLVLAFALCGLGAETPRPASREYDVKAAFIYNFATFVDWPSAAFPRSDSPFVIGVIGADPFGTALEEMVLGEQVKGRPIVVRHIDRGDRAAACHILFISASESARLGEILPYVQDRPVLTVGDAPGFIEAGGSIGFVTTNRVSFRINPVSLRASNLTMSSKLLRLAQTAQLPPPQP